MLYQGLVEKLVPTEEPTPEEKRAIKEEDELADEEELKRALGRKMFSLKVKRKALRYPTKFVPREYIFLIIR
jgi:hypothetical protein